jgi:hypothetical protein
LYRHNSWTVVFEEKGEIIINADFFAYVSKMENRIKELEDALKQLIDYWNQGACIKATQEGSAKLDDEGLHGLTVNGKPDCLSEIYKMKEQ